MNFSSLGIRMEITLTEIYKPIQEQIERVAEGVRQVWEDTLKLVDIDTSMAPKAKGKLLRPAICLLSAGIIGKKDLNVYIPLSTSFELLHLASLTHDDVIDRAIIRRGGQSLNSLWNNHAAVLGGDYLVARATELLGRYESHELILNSVQCVREMAEGELKFFTKSINNFTIDNCRELARKKTAMLFACSASTPALLENLPERDNLFRFGESIGIVFQFIDDLLDLTQDSNILGKPRYSDIIEQKVTLPILLLWEQMETDEKDFFNSIFGKPLTEKEQKWIEEKLERYKIKKSTIQYAEELKLLAIKELDKFPNSDFKKSLTNLCHFIVQRQN